MNDLAGFVAAEPGRVLADERRVRSSVIDDQVDHQLHAELVDLPDHGAKLLIRRAGSGIDQKRIQRAIIRDGIEAAGDARLLDGIDEDPVEAHPAGALEMRLPCRERSRQQWKQVIDARSFRNTFWLQNTFRPSERSNSGGCL